MKNIIIIGASGFSSAVLDCLQKEDKYNVVGFIDSYLKVGIKRNGYEVLGNEFDLPFLIEQHNLYGGIIAIGDNWIRKAVADRIQKISPNFNFVSTIHPSSTIGLNVSIGKGTVLMAGSIISANVSVNDFCIVNGNAYMGHDGYMDDFSSLAPMCCVGGGFNLGEFSAVCLGAKVIEGVSIGSHTVIGAGSLVVDNMPDNVVAYGSPAKIIRERTFGEPYLSKPRKNKSIPHVLK